jgi:hypothetical protein
LVVNNSFKLKEFEYCLEVLWKMVPLIKVLSALKLVSVNGLMNKILIIYMLIIKINV